VPPLIRGGLSEAQWFKLVRKDRIPVLNTRGNTRSCGSIYDVRSGVAMRPVLGDHRVRGNPVPVLRR
jgi:hypothetical protein